MFNLTYFQTKFPIISDPGVLAIPNHLVMLGMPVPGSGLTSAWDQVAQHGVQNVLGVIHGGLQEVVPNLPTVIGVQVQTLLSLRTS